MVRRQTSDGHTFVIGFFFLMEIEKSDNQTSDVRQSGTRLRRVLIIVAAGDTAFI